MNIWSSDVNLNQILSSGPSGQVVKWLNLGHVTFWSRGYGRRSQVLKIIYQVHIYQVAFKVPYSGDDRCVFFRTRLQVANPFIYSFVINTSRMNVYQNLPQMYGPHQTHSTNKKVIYGVFIAWFQMCPLSLRLFFRKRSSLCMWSV